MQILDYFVFIFVFVALFAAAATLIETFLFFFCLKSRSKWENLIKFICKLFSIGMNLSDWWRWATTTPTLALKKKYSHTHSLRCVYKQLNVFAANWTVTQKINIKKNASIWNFNISFRCCCCCCSFLCRLLWIFNFQVFKSREKKK